MQILQSDFFFKRSRNSTISSARIPKWGRVVYIYIYTHTHTKTRMSLNTQCFPPTYYESLKPTRSINTMSAMFLSSYCCQPNTDVGHLLCIVSTSRTPGTISKKENVCWSHSLSPPVQTRSFKSSKLLVLIYKNKWPEICNKWPEICRN